MPPRGRKRNQKRGAAVTRLLTVEQVRERIGSTERTVRRYIATGALPARRFGPVMKKTGLPRNVRVDEIDLEMFVRSKRIP